MIKTLNELIEMAKAKTTRRVAVAAAADMPVLKAIKDAMNEGIVIPILIGEEAKIREMASQIDLSLENIEIVDEANAGRAAQIAVKKVRDGEADILMKGLVSSGSYLKAILDKENGLRSGDTLSHFSIF
jgi:phosphate butyryltransferase